MISEKPSLYLKPTAYKTSVLYCQLPEGSVGNMTFARADTNASRINKDGLVEFVATGIPRLDYPLINGVVQSCPELLLEPTRTNLCLRSEEFDNASWVKSGVGVALAPVVTANASISPDGTKSADRVIFDLNGGLLVGDYSTLQQTITVATTTTYTLSFWIKSNIGKSATLLIRDDISETFNETFTATTKWKRLIFTGTTGGSTTFNYKIWTRGTQGTDDYADVSIWGSQLELGDYKTSYIKTIGSSVIRATETCNSAGDSTTFNSVEGVLYCQISALFDTQSNREISISDGSVNNTIEIRYTTSSNAIQFLIRHTSGTIVVNYTDSSFIITDNLKIAMSYKLNDVKMYINGTEVSTDTSAVMPTGLNTFRFEDGAGTSDFYGRVKDIRVYKTALTGAELTELTTI